MLKSNWLLALSRGLFLCSVTAISLAQAGEAQPRPARRPRRPELPPAVDPALAIKRFQVPPGFKVDLFAAEPQLQNPVAFCFDEQGRCYVAETYRDRAGVLDIRGIMSWLDEDLACRTVDDRLAEMKRHLGSSIADFTQYTDQIRLLEDRDGDGRADRSTVFAAGFNQIVDGIGASVLARHGDVWYTCIPNLWLLRDTNGDGVADFRQSLQSGYGVRVGYLGHDLHGLCFGPDGKLYFSIGDRAANVENDGHSVVNTESGSVFRCNPDGSDLELFCFGLRNPQQLVFDQYGNLWTGDNNSDSGDQARWVYLVEGADNGWRVGYQFMQPPYSRGAFNAEKLWYPHFDGQAAYLVPPIANIADGPSGVAHDTGTGLPKSLADHFFLVDFRGSTAISGIHTFTVQPKGAYFELVNRAHFVWNALATDVKIGIGGGVYFSDWVQGWQTPNRGRIYRVHDPVADQSPEVLETKRLLAEGLARRSDKELARLLAQPDQRVRQEAQFALADKGSRAIRIFAEVAKHDLHPLARLHAIWGLGQIGRKDAAALAPLPPLLNDRDAEVRAQTAQVLGNDRFARACDGLVKALDDSSPRVQFFAAIGLGKLGRREAEGPLFGLLRENADKDPFLRHAGVMGLLGINDLNGVLAAAGDPSPSVRMGVLLVLRRLQRPEIAQFLNDPDPELVIEAARAINDMPIHGAGPELAALSARPGLNEPVLRRVLNANLRLGTLASAKALAQFAALAGAPEKMRVEALDELANWPHPSGRDRIIGLWRPMPARRGDWANEALGPVMADILRTAPDAVRIGAARTAGQLAMQAAAPALFELVGAAKLSGSVRVAALDTLVALKAERAADAVKLALADNDPRLREAGTRLQAQVAPAGDAASRLAATLEQGTIGEQQAAFAALGAATGPEADDLLSQWLDKLLAGQVAKEIQFDLLEAAAKRTVPAVKEKLARYENSCSKNDDLAGYRELLYGGDPVAGRKVFFERPEASCMRCHKIKGEGGEVGPDLSTVGTRQTREYILESILFPNKQIAPGFENLLITMKNGTSYAGVLKSEDANQLVINSPEDGLLKLKQSEIQSRDKGLSAMPEGMGNILSKPDLRNLVAFLSGLK